MNALKNPAVMFVLLCICVQNARARPIFDCDEDDSEEELPIVTCKYGQKSTNSEIKKRLSRSMLDDYLKYEISKCNPGWPHINRNGHLVYLIPLSLSNYFSISCSSNNKVYDPQRKLCVSKKKFRINDNYITVTVLIGILLTKVQTESNMANYLAVGKDPTICIRIIQFLLSLVCYGIFCGSYIAVPLALRIRSTSESELTAVIRFTFGLTAIVFFPVVVFPVNVVAFFFFPETRLSPLVALYDAAGTICYFSTGMILIINLTKFSNVIDKAAGVMAGFCILTAFVYGAAIGIFVWNYMLHRRNRANNASAV